MRQCMACVSDDAIAGNSSLQWLVAWPAQVSSFGGGSAEWEGVVGERGR
eukprot:gene22661-biopygen23757